MKLHEVQEDDFLSVGDVASIFNVSENVVRADIKNGNLGHVIIGSTYRIPGWAVIEKALVNTESAAEIVPPSEVPDKLGMQ